LIPRRDERAVRLGRVRCLDQGRALRGVLVAEVAQVALGALAFFPARLGAAGPGLGVLLERRRRSSSFGDARVVRRRLGGALGSQRRDLALDRGRFPFRRRHAALGFFQNSRSLLARHVENTGGLLPRQGFRGRRRLELALQHQLVRVALLLRRQGLLGVVLRLLRLQQSVVSRLNSVGDRGVGLGEALVRGAAAVLDVS
jgi:hypothetical protein